MLAAESWFRSAKIVYGGRDMDALLDRAIRVKGEADLVVFTFLMLDELRRLRESMESLASKVEAR